MGSQTGGAGAGRLSGFVQSRAARYREIHRGLLICLLIALATTFIADHYGGPTLLYALLFGMSLHFLSENESCRPGIEFTARTVLRFGVALLGARMTLAEVEALGVGPVLLVVVAVAVVILGGVIIARFLGLPRDLGLLTGGAVAICGASAALALSAVMPRHETHERNTILTVVGVTTLSTLAMVTYPLIVGVLGLPDSQAGIFLGATIHDVAQVVGAGYMISDQTGDISTLIKLLRVAMLVPVVLVFMWVFRHQTAGDADTGRRIMLPGFLVAFILLVVVNSLGLIPDAVGEGLSSVSRWCLVAAISALGIKTSFQKLAVVGWRPVILMLLETGLLLALVLAVVVYAGLGR